MGQVMAVIATTVMCCLIFSWSVPNDPAIHLGHTEVKSEAGEVGMMLVPILAVILLGFAWDFRSYVALAIGSASIFGLHLAGFFAPIARRIMLSNRFADNLETFINIQFRQLAEGAIRARYLTLAIAIAAFLSGMAILASGRLPFFFSTISIGSGRCQAHHASGYSCSGD